MSTHTQTETQALINERNQWMIVALEKRQAVADLRRENAALKRGQNDALLTQKSEIIEEQRQVIKRLRREIAQKDAELCADPDLRLVALKMQVKEQSEMIDGLRATIARLEGVGR